MLVKWLPALALHCRWTRRLETKGLLVSPPPPLPSDRFFLFNQRVKRETERGGGRGGLRGDGRRAKWWGRVESQKLLYRKPVSGVRAAEPLLQGRGANRTPAVPSTQPASLFSPLRAAGSFGFLRHREITYIISHKITQSNSYLPTSSPRSLLENCFNK